LLTVTLAGQVIEGACVSFTLTVNEQLDPLVVLQLTVVTPVGKNDPELGEQVTGPQLTFAVGV